MKKVKRTKSFQDSPHGEPSSRKGWRRRWLRAMASIDGLASQGLDSLRDSSERFLRSPGDHAGRQIPVSDGVVEVASATATSAAMEAIPSSDGTSTGDMLSGPGAAGPAQLAGVLVHPSASAFGDPPGLEPHLPRRHFPFPCPLSSSFPSRSLYFVICSAIFEAASPDLLSLYLCQVILASSI